MGVLVHFMHRISLQMQSDNPHQSYAEFICAQNSCAVGVNPSPLKS